jgi:hypothetical protein
LKLWVAGNEGDGAEVETVVQNFVGDIAREHAVDADLHAGMQLTEFCESGEQGVDGAFVYAERELAALEAFEFGQTLGDFVAEIDEALGVVFEQGAGVSHAHGACAAHEEGLAEAVFKFADGKADSGLSAVKTLGGARKAAFLGDHEKNLQLTQIHGFASAREYKTGLSKAEQR